MANLCAIFVPILKLYTNLLLHFPHYISGYQPQHHGHQYQLPPQQAWSETMAPPPPAPPGLAVQFPNQPMGQGTPYGNPYPQQGHYHQHGNQVIPGVGRGQPQEQQHQSQMVFGQPQTTHHQPGWNVGGQQANAQGLQQRSSGYGSSRSPPRAGAGRGFSTMSRDSRPGGGGGQGHGPVDKSVASTSTQQQQSTTNKVAVKQEASLLDITDNSAASVAMETTQSKPTNVKVEIVKSETPSGPGGDGINQGNAEEGTTSKPAAPNQAILKLHSPPNVDYKPTVDVKVENMQDAHAIRDNPGQDITTTQSGADQNKTQTSQQRPAGQHTSIPPADDSPTADDHGSDPRSSSVPGKELSTNQRGEDKGRF